MLNLNPKYSGKKRIAILQLQAISHTAPRELRIKILYLKISRIFGILQMQKSTRNHLRDTRR